MWTANRAPSRSQRSTSINSVASAYSVASQVQSQRAGGYESDASSDTANEDDVILQNVTFTVAPSSTVPAMWQPGRQETGSAVPRLGQKFAATATVTEITPPSLKPYRQQNTMHSIEDDDARSRSSTLGGEEQDFEFPEKTPTCLPKFTTAPADISADTADDAAPEATPPPPTHTPGPLETQLASLMSTLVFMERANPTVSVTPEDYAALTSELAALRSEKATWQKRHESLFALRDEDVENNIKIRGMLAKARRDLDAMTKLRDDDLVNLQAVRCKLAESTRKIEKLEAAAVTQGTQGTQGLATGRVSPARARPGSVHMMMERRGTMDLFAAAKAAALEQRALELEQRNMDLVSQIDMLKGGASIDDLNRMTAHKAWKDTVTELEAKLRAKDAELARLRSGNSTATPASTSGNGIGWTRLELLHEEHAAYREKAGAKMQALRSEKEALQKELHRKEDENDALEVKVQSLQRRVAVQ